MKALSCVASISAEVPTLEATSFLHALINQADFARGNPRRSRETTPRSKSSVVSPSKLAAPSPSMRARALLVALCAGVSATDPFVVTFDVTLATGKKDSFDLEVQPEWAPLGAARFKELVDEEFFTSVRFFRVLPGFMAQFGIHGKPEISSTWRDRKLSGIDTAQC